MRSSSVSWVSSKRGSCQWKEGAADIGMLRFRNGYKDGRQPGRRFRPGYAFRLRLGRQGLFANLLQGGRWRNGFGIDQAVQYGWFAAGQGSFEGGSELLGRFDAFAMAAEGLCVGGEIGILQRCGGRARGV